MDWTWYLFGFKGRIKRAKMWLSVLIILCWMFFLGMLSVIVSGGKAFEFGLDDLFRIVDPAVYRTLSWAHVPYLLIEVTGTALFVWVYFATSIKRLHDRDKSGWWMVPFFVAPGLYNQFADRLGDSYLAISIPHAGRPCHFRLRDLGLHRNVFPEGIAKDQPVRARPAAPIDTRPRWEQQSEIEMVPHKAGPPPVWHVKPGA